MSDELYTIEDIDGYANSVRDGVAKSFSENYSENLDDFISIDQVKNLIKKNNLGTDENGNYIINEEIFENLFNELRDWMYGIALSKLAAKGLVECAWDNNQNEMVFWLSDKKNTTINNKPS